MSEKIFNPASGRMVLKNGAIGKKLRKEVEAAKATAKDVSVKPKAPSNPSMRITLPNDPLRVTPPKEAPAVPKAAPKAAPKEAPAAPEDWLKKLVEAFQNKFASTLKKKKISTDWDTKGQTLDDSRIVIRLSSASQHITMQLNFDKSKFNTGKIIRRKEDAETSIKFKVLNPPSNQMKKMIKKILSTSFTSVTIEYECLRYVSRADKLMPYSSDYDREYSTQTEIQKFKDIWSALNINIDWKNWVEDKDDEDVEYEIIRV